MSANPFQIIDGKPVWSVNLEGAAGFQAVEHSNDFRLFHFPSGALLSWALKLSDASNESLVVHHVFDPADGASKAYIDLVAKTGRLRLIVQGEGGFEREISVGSAKLLRLLNQGVAYNGRLSATNGAEAVRAFLELFTPAFNEGGLEAAWGAVEKGIGLFNPAKPAAGASSSELGGESQASRRGPEDKKPESSQSDTRHFDGTFEPLLRSAKPDLYRVNGFRIAELSVLVQGRDLDRRQKLIDMAAQTGAAIPPGPHRALPLNGALDGEKLREAMSRLRDPVQRLLDELFWFWPLDGGGTDPALALLAEGQVRPAFESWKKRGAQGDPEGVATHNVAVLCHATALDLEDPIASKSLKDVAPSDAPSFWDLAFRAWKLVLETNAFWDRLVARIRDLNDPRLPESAARSIRRTLPLALLGINAKLAGQAAAKSDHAAAQRHRRVLDASGLDAELTDQAMRSASDPLRERLDILCGDAEKAYQDDPEKGDKVAVELLEKATPILQGIDGLFPKGNSAREAAHDAVAMRARMAVIQYGNATSVNTKVVDLMKRASAVAEGEAARQTLEGDLETADRLIKEAKENEVYLKCWFCPSGDSDLPSAATVDMYGDVTREFNRVKWRTTTMKVPRCNACKGVHDRTRSISEKFAVAGLIIAAIVVLGFFFGSDGKKDGGAFVGLGCGGLIACGIAAGIFAFIGAAVGRSTSPSAVKAEEHKAQFPTILDAQRQGWKIGTKPEGVQ